MLQVEVKKPNQNKTVFTMEVKVVWKIKVNKLNDWKQSVADLVNPSLPEVML